VCTCAAVIRFIFAFLRRKRDGTRSRVSPLFRERDHARNDDTKNENAPGDRRRLLPRDEDGTEGPSTVGRFLQYGHSYSGRVSRAARYDRSSRVSDLGVDGGGVCDSFAKTRPDSND